MPVNQQILFAAKPHSEPCASPVPSTSSRLLLEQSKSARNSSPQFRVEAASPRHRHLRQCLQIHGASSSYLSSPATKSGHSPAPTGDGGTSQTMTTENTKEPDPAVASGWRESYAKARETRKRPKMPTICEKNANRFGH